MTTPMLMTSVSGTAVMIPLPRTVICDGLAGVAVAGVSVLVLPGRLWAAAPCGSIQADRRAPNSNAIAATPLMTTHSLLLDFITGSPCFSIDLYVFLRLWTLTYPDDPNRKKVPAGYEVTKTHSGVRAIRFCAVGAGFKPALPP